MAIWAVHRVGVMPGDISFAWGPQRAFPPLPPLPVLALGCFPVSERTAKRNLCAHEYTPNPRYLTPVFPAYEPGT